jgi:hypothetical protein
MRVDTKTSGFVVLDVPLGSTLTVGGKVTGNASERALEATGIRY